MDPELLQRLEAQLAETEQQGLFKRERVIASAQAPLVRLGRLAGLGDLEQRHQLSRVA